MRGRVLIGTSGWSYPHWKGPLYPPGLKAGEWLSHYATVFPTVELNGSFYRLPTATMFRDWRAKTPPGFIFAVKVSRYITHVKALKNVEEPWRLFLERARVLEHKLGPLLLQFPPTWHADADRLAGFLEPAPTDLRLAFEFRHESWFNEDVYRILSGHGSAALVAADSARYPTVFHPTAGFMFVRMHGGTQLYGSEYSEDELADLAGRLERYLAGGLDVYAYFNNDAHGFAVKNAGRLTELLTSPDETRRAAKE